MRLCLQNHLLSQVFALPFLYDMKLNIGEVVGLCIDELSDLSNMGDN
jgi:hypothetical protein